MRASVARLDELAQRHPHLVGERHPENVAGWEATLRADEKGTDMSPDNTKQVAFRLPEKLIERIDLHVARMQEQNPGLNPTRADAARVLLTIALDHVEGQEPKPRKRAR